MQDCLAGSALPLACCCCDHHPCQVVPLPLAPPALLLARPGLQASSSTLHGAMGAEAALQPALHHAIMQATAAAQGTRPAAGSTPTMLPPNVVALRSLPWQVYASVIPTSLLASRGPEVSDGMH
jgi:hypothetical protein